MKGPLRDWPLSTGNVFQPDRTALRLLLWHFRLQAVDLIARRQT